MYIAIYMFTICIYMQFKIISELVKIAGYSNILNKSQLIYCVEILFLLLSVNIWRKIYLIYSTDAISLS